MHHALGLEYISIIKCIWYIQMSSCHVSTLPCVFLDIIHDGAQDQEVYIAIAARIALNVHHPTHVMQR